MLNDLIINKLKEIIKLQDIIKTDELYFLVIILTYCFPKTYTWSKFANKLKGRDKVVKSIEKKLFQSNKGLFFTAKEKVFNNFKPKLFPTKNLEPTLGPEVEQEVEPELDRKLILNTEKFR